MARLCDFHCRFTMLQSHLWLYKVSKMGEGDLVLMSIDAFENTAATCKCLTSRAGTHRRCSYPQCIRSQKATQGAHEKCIMLSGVHISI